MSSSTAETIETITGHSPDEIVQGLEGAWNALLNWIPGLIPSIFEFLVRCLVALIIYLIGRGVIKWIRRRAQRSFERKHADKTAMKFTDSLLQAILYIVLIMLVCANLGIDLSSVTVVFASASVGITLALQESLSNLAGGFFILLLRPFNIGDYIIESTNNLEGTVQDIRIFYTVLWTLDSRSVVIPNGQLMNNSLTNITANAERQLDLKIQVSYQSDLRMAKSIVEGILKDDPRILDDRDNYVFVDKLGEYAVTLGARAWAKRELYFKTLWDIQEEIKVQFDQAGILMAFNQVMVQMQNPPTAAPAQESEQK